MTFDARRDGDPVAAAQAMLGADEASSPAARALQVALSAWGYDFHHPANVARSNDLLVRQRVTGWIRDAAAAADDLERRYARERVPPATKEHPFPDPEVTRTMRALRGLRDKLQSLAAQIDVLEVPAGDRVWNRFSKERALLDALVTADCALLAYAQTIRTATLQLDVGSVDAHAPFRDIDAILADLEQQLRSRADILRI
jgi:hypothetical protein